METIPVLESIKVIISKMRIGIVTSWFERGAAYVSRQFMDVLQKTDEVFIYARGGENYAKGDPKWDLPNVYWGKHTGFVHYFASYIVKGDFIKWLKRERIELVFFNEQHYFSPIVWCKDLGIKTAAYIDYYTENTIPFFNAYDCLVCNTERHKFAFRNHPNAQYLKWGTNISLYKPTDSENSILTFFHSAGMGPFRKGTDLLIKAFYNSKSRAKAKLFIHTQVSLSEKFPELRTIINELLAEGSLEIEEGTVSAPGLYYKGDVYVYPSRLDGIGLTLMEAASSGLACITVDNAPMNEFVNPSFASLARIDYYYCRSDGYYWPMGVVSLDSLSSLIEDYISGLYNVSEMKAKAREYAESELDFNKNTERLHNIFESVKVSQLSNILRSKIKSYDRLPIHRLMYFFYKLYQPIKKIERRQMR